MLLSSAAGCHAVVPKLLSRPELSCKLAIFKPRPKPLWLECFVCFFGLVLPKNTRIVARKDVKPTGGGNGEIQQQDRIKPAAFVLNENR